MAASKACLQAPSPPPPFQYPLGSLRSPIFFALFPTKKPGPRLRRPLIITKCCSPCYKMRRFHLLQNATTLITKCASYSVQNAAEQRTSYETSTHSELTKLQSYKVGGDHILYCNKYNLFHLFNYSTFL